MAENSKGGLLAKAQKRINRTKTKKSSKGAKIHEVIHEEPEEESMVSTTRKGGKKGSKKSKVHEKLSEEEDGLSVPASLKSEKVLQNLGKAERTTDEIFDDLVQRIEKQQETAHQLQKELKHYIQCARALSGANKILCDGVANTYEAEWTEEKGFKESVQCFGLLWADLLQKLTERTLEPLNTYLASFPPLKAKINKRGRKQVDYDNARHNLEVLQNAKKRDEAKITKAQEDLAECKKIYEELNNELHTELPDFYNSRVTFYAQLFQDLYSSENTFFCEMGKVSNGLVETSAQLAKDFEHFAYKPQLHRPVSKTSSEMDEDSPIYNGREDAASGGSPASASRGSEVKIEATPQENSDADDHVYLNQDVAAAAVAVAADSMETGENNDSASSTQEKDASMVNGDGEGMATEGDKDQEKRTSAGVPSFPAPNPPAEADTPKVADPVDGAGDDADEEDGNVYDEPKPVAAMEASDYEVPPSNKPLSSPSSLTTPPPGCLYEVVTTHPYQGEDVDELNFGAGETIYVVPYDDPEEQDAGWQMGVRQLNGMKGVFPENFTKRV